MHTSFITRNPNFFEFLGITPVSSVSNGLYFLILRLVSVMRVIYTSKGMSKKFGVRVIHQVRVIYRKIRCIFYTKKKSVKKLSHILKGSIKLYHKNYKCGSYIKKKKNFIREKLLWDQVFYCVTKRRVFKLQRISYEVLLNCLPCLQSRTTLMDLLLCNTQLLWGTDDKFCQYFDPETK
jgi:hypothetical protein